MIKRTACGCLFVGILLSGCAGAGGDKREILAVTDDFFEAMASRDVELASTVVVPEGAFVSVRPGNDGPEGGGSSNAEWLARLPNRESDVRERFTGSPLVLVEGDVAVLWGEYEFEVDGKQTHTGIDVFNFVRTEDGWKLAGGVYSATPDR